jgi:hypothetical protein
METGFQEPDYFSHLFFDEINRKRKNLEAQEGAATWGLNQSFLFPLSL